MKKNTMLKVIGILMIVFGGIGIITSLLAFVGVGAIISLAETASGEEFTGTGMIYFSLVISLVSTGITLAAGIVGVKGSTKPELAKTCAIFGYVIIGLTVLSTILAATYSNFNILGLLTGSALPVLLIIGANQSKKIA